MVTVRTKEELKKAINEKVESICVEGDLAVKVQRSYKLKKMSKVSLGILVASLTGGVALSPVTGGLSLAAAAPIAALTGAEIAVIIAVSAIGIGIVLAVIKGYDVTYEGIPGQKGFKVKLKNKNM